MNIRHDFFQLALVALVTGCNANAKQQTWEQRVQLDIKGQVSEQLTLWRAASAKLMQAAPEPLGRGWDPAQDASAIDAMKAHWLEARHAYELIEGAVAPTFPESDAATDARYDDFLAQLGAGGDPYDFDGEGVIGMHAIERVLWSDTIPEDVVVFERGLPGYRAPSFPKSKQQATDFKRRLLARMLSDIEQLQAQFEPLELDIAFAFRGLLDLAVEQVEKVDLAATGREESRYAQTTMRDLRSNHRGCVNAYTAFRPWLLERDGGTAIDAKVNAAFERLRKAYELVDGDAIPRPPATWSSLAPSAPDLESPFGRLFAVVSHEADPEQPGSLHASLVLVARTLGLPPQVTR